MRCDEFCEVFWAHYISIEKEFLKTISYVHLDRDNNKTYSEAFLKLLLAIGSEVDLTMKFYCNLLDASFNGSNIVQYRDCIRINKLTFFDDIVSVKKGSLTIEPWNNKDSGNNIISPFWWEAYNKCKHQRTEIVTINGEAKKSYKFANLENVLAALAGLYQTLIYSYKILADNEGKKVLTPLPGSRLFELTGPDWEEISFYNDRAFYVDNGELIMETSTLYY